MSGDCQLGCHEDAGMLGHSGLKLSPPVVFAHLALVLCSRPNK